MNKATFIFSIGISMLTLTMPLQSTAAEGFNPDQWDAYCKTHKERCMKASQICEEYGNADCDQIKLAMMQKRPIPKSMLRGEGKPEPKK